MRNTVVYYIYIIYNTVAVYWFIAVVCGRRMCRWSSGTTD